MSLGGLGNPKRSLGDSKKTMYLFARRHHRPQCLPCSFQNIGECNFCPISLDPRFCYTCTLQHPKNTSCTNTGGSQLTPKFPTIIPSYITRDKPSWNHFQANGMKGKKTNAMQDRTPSSAPGGSTCKPHVKTEPSETVALLLETSEAAKQLPSLRRGRDQPNPLWAKKMNGPVDVARMGLAESILLLVIDSNFPTSESINPIQIVLPPKPNNLILHATNYCKVDEN